MRHPRAGILLLIFLTLPGAAARAGVAVDFVAPQSYSDDDFRSPSVRAGILADFAAYFVRLGKLYLKPGQDLRIEVLDIRLAGDYEPWRRHFNDVRILRDVTPPRFVLRYVLRQNGRLVASATDTVTDIAYLWDPAAARSLDRFPYEKAMLKAWFRRRFAPPNP